LHQITINYKHKCDSLSLQPNSLNRNVTVNVKAIFLDKVQEAPLTDDERLLNFLTFLIRNLNTTRKNTEGDKYPHQQL
jgi:hypothetical protein